MKRNHLSLNILIPMTKRRRINRNKRNPSFLRCIDWHMSSGYVPFFYELTISEFYVFLLSTLQNIDYATAVVPRGAYIVSATHHIMENTSFHGLTLSEAESLGNYYHFRYPENTKRKSVLEKRGMVQSTDFLDPLSEDSPNGVWCLQTNMHRGQTVLRSLEYPGYFFFHTIGTRDYGGAYFGDGQPNRDLPFMV